MVLFSIWHIDLTVIGICLFLLLSSILGKLSPKSVLILIMACIVSYLGIFRTSIIEKEQIVPDIPATAMDTIISKDTLLKKANPILKQPQKKKVLNESPQTRDNKILRDNKESISDELIPKEYDASKDFRNYRTEGKWKWNDKFEQAIKDRTGWSKLKKGNYIISIDYEESFKEVDGEGQRKFIYLGDKIEISVNSKICCCDGIISIPNGIDGKNISDVKRKVQNSITSLLLENEELVINKIQACL